MYHIGLDDEGKIIIGTKTKTGKWNNKTEVTAEALAATRDHLLKMIAKEKQDIYYGWQYSNGKTVLLKLEEKNTSDIKEQPNESTEDTQAP